MHTTVLTRKQGSPHRVVHRAQPLGALPGGNAWPVSLCSSAALRNMTVAHVAHAASVAVPGAAPPSSAAHARIAASIASTAGAIAASAVYASSSSGTQPDTHDACTGYEKVAHAVRMAHNMAPQEIRMSRCGATAF